MESCAQYSLEDSIHDEEKDPQFWLIEVREKSIQPRVCVYVCVLGRRGWQILIKCQVEKRLDVACICSFLSWKEHLSLIWKNPTTHPRVSTIVFFRKLSLIHSSEDIYLPCYGLLIPRANLRTYTCHTQLFIYLLLWVELYTHIKYTLEP